MHFLCMANLEAEDLEFSRLGGNYGPDSGAREIGIGSVNEVDLDVQAATLLCKVFRKPEFLQSA